jgi:hypothetical protein
MDGVVLAVDRQDRDTSTPRRVHHERARHHQHFLVGERDRLARIDRATTASSAAVPDDAQITMSTAGCVATAIRPSAPPSIAAAPDAHV